MKPTDKKTDTRKIASICGLSALSLAVLAGAYFLTREPEAEFIPSSVQTDTATDTWRENAGTDVERPENLPDGPIRWREPQTTRRRCSSAKMIPAPQPSFPTAAPGPIRKRENRSRHRKALFLTMKRNRIPRIQQTPQSPKPRIPHLQEKRLFHPHLLWKRNMQGRYMIPSLDGSLQAIPSRISLTAAATSTNRSAP